MTDHDIIKALELCASTETRESCRDCPMCDKCADDPIILQKMVLDLVKRQQAEIEMYKSEMPYLSRKDADFCGTACKFVDECVVKAIQEFAERLKGTLEFKTEPLDEYDIDELAEEMTEERK